MTTDITELAQEAASESGSILIIVAARMARREFFTPLHALCEAGKRVVSTRALHDAVERAEERMVSQVPKIVDGHDRLTKKLKEAESRNAELVEALEKAKGMETYWKTQCRGITDHCEELQARIAQLESRTVTAAAADVLAERKRQVMTEGWTPEHDDQHVNFEMAIAGGLYAISAVDSHHKLCNSAPSAWTWDRKWWKPDGPRRDLVKAGALILAEIERLDRAAGIKVETE